MLSRNGEPIHLEPQAFDMLVRLIERRDEVVSNGDLLGGEADHSHVTETSIATRIREIRRAVGDDGATQHTIRNVHGRGYRFVAEPAAEPVRRDHGPIGREHEVDEVVARLAGWPVVTLVGPGGVGKSTLARSAAQRISGTTRAHLLRVSSLAHGGDVLPALCRSLDTVLDPGRPEVAITTIARLDAVLVLDDCEHVVDHVAELVDGILAAPGRTTRVLATSQLRLGVADELVIGLASLAPDDAEALFVACAETARPDWSVTEVGRDRLGRLVDRLDRLPLTIEIAATRLASMTFDELERDVERVLEPSASTGREPPLGALLPWSADRLEPDHRRVFVDFSVFADAVSARDAAAVIGPGTSGALAELADRSLLSVDRDGPTVRYRMLAGAKAVAVRRLDGLDAGSAVRRRHAEAVADALERVDEALRSSDEPAARRRLDEIDREVRQAFRWAGDHAVGLLERMSAALHLASYNRLWSEPAAWAVDALAASDVGPLPATRTLVAAAEAGAGHLRIARNLAIEVLGDTTDSRLAASAHEVLADIAFTAGRLDAAAHHSTELERLGVEVADSHLAAIAAINRSRLRTRRDDADGGLAAVRLLDRTVLSRTDLARIAYVEGTAFSRLGERDRAVASFGRAIDLAASVANPVVISLGRGALAAELARAGATRAAYEAFGVALRSAVRHGNLVHAATMMCDLVTLLVADGDQRAATVLATAVADEVDRAPDGDERSRLASVLAQVESEVWPDRFASWQAEGRALDLDAAVRRAVAIIEGHLR